MWQGLLIRASTPIVRVPLRTFAFTSIRSKGDEKVMDQAALSRKVDPQEAAMRKAADLLARKARQKQNSEAFSFKPMASDKIDQLEKERKEAEARQRAEKEEREAKIKRQERLVRILVFGGFIFVICYNLVKTFSAKNETIIITQQPEKKLEKCEVELLARNACRKEVEELCSALGIKASGDDCKASEDKYSTCCESEGIPLQE